MHLAFELDVSRKLGVAQAIRGALRVTTVAPFAACTVVLRARLLASRAGAVHALGGYDAPLVEHGPFDWSAGAHRVEFELPPVRGPVTHRGRAIALEWTIVAEVRDASNELVASATQPIEIVRHADDELIEDVAGGYRDAARQAAKRLEPNLGSKHVEGVREPKLTIGERIDALLTTRTIDAQLEVTPLHAEPGATLGVTLFLYVRSAATLQAANVTLVHRERAGDFSNVEDIAEAPLTDHVELAPGHRKFHARVTLPEDAAPSYADDAIASEWIVRAVAQPHWEPPIVIELVLAVV